MSEGERDAVKVVDRRWWAQQGETPETAGTAGAAEEWQPGKPTYVEELERQLADKDKQLQETVARYRDASREFDEMRARLRKDVAREVERGRRTMLAELLEVVDNLDRAIGAAQQATSVESLLSGVSMVRQLFLAKLEGFGVHRIDPLGKKFDPSLHEAVTAVPTTDPAQDDQVCGVLMPGYIVNDEVLRPAMVAVSRLSHG